MPPKKPRQHPAMTYEARIARDRIPVNIDMKAWRLELLDRAKEIRQESRSQVIAAALDILFKKMGLSDGEENR